MFTRTLLAVSLAFSVGAVTTPSLAAGKGGQSAEHKSGFGGKSAEHRRDGFNKWGGAKGFNKTRPGHRDAVE